MEAVEAVEAVAVEGGLLEEDTGEVGKGYDRSASLDSSKRSMELVTTVEGRVTSSISEPGVGQPRNEGKRQGKQCPGESWPGNVVHGECW